MNAVPKLRPSGDVLARRVGDELVLVHLKTNRIYSLNVTGARLWELLTEGNELEEIRAAMSRQFDVDESHLNREIDSLVSSLVDERLVAAE